jgi:hypothetical protein
MDGGRGFKIHKCMCNLPLPPPPPPLTTTTIIIIIYVLICFVYTSFQVSILPPLASIFVTSIAAQVADNLIANGVETTTVCRETEPFLLCPYINHDGVGKIPNHML